MAPSKTKKAKVWTRRTDIIKSELEIFEGGQASDVIIPVMGKPGVGKSEFVSKLLGKPAMEAGRDIGSRMPEVQCEVIDPALITRICPRWEGHGRVVVVEMPGFAKISEDDEETLRRIGAWLASSYADDMKLGGIVYLHNIAERKMDGADVRNLEIFKKLCGNKALREVVVGTTRWEDVEPEVGDTREKSFREKVWKKMIANGSTIARFEHTQHSAFEIIQIILERRLDRPDDFTALRIQEELVDSKWDMPRTEAGKKLLAPIKPMMEKYKGVHPMDGKEEVEEEEKLGRKEEALLVRRMKAMRLPVFTRFKASFGL